MKRLIDADELKNKLRSLGWFDDDDESFTSCLEDIIDDAPTIDAQPVVHAKWTYYKNNGITDYFKCSDCGNVVKVSLDDFPKNKFCNNCGARMDGN